jgi:hypothetical protein
MLEMIISISNSYQSLLIDLHNNKEIFLLRFNLIFYTLEKEFLLLWMFELYYNFHKVSSLDPILNYLN